jgi:hypothetical protein
MYGPFVNIQNLQGSSKAAVEALNDSTPGSATVSAHTFGKAVEDPRGYGRQTRIEKGDL